MKFYAQIIILIALSCVCGRKLKRNSDFNVSQVIKTIETINDVQGSTELFYRMANYFVDGFDLKEIKVTFNVLKLLAIDFYKTPKLSTIETFTSTREAAIQMLSYVFKADQERIQKIHSQDTDEEQEADINSEKNYNQQMMEYIDKFGKENTTDLNDRQGIEMYYNRLYHQMREHDSAMAKIYEKHRAQRKQNVKYTEGFLEETAGKREESMIEIEFEMREHWKTCYFSGILSELEKVKKNPKNSTKCLAFGLTRAGNSKKSDSKFEAALQEMKQSSTHTEADFQKFLKCAYKYTLNFEGLESNSSNQEAFTSYLIQYLTKFNKVPEDEIETVLKKLKSSLNTPLIQLK